MQGNYSDILNSGIDISSMIKQNDDAENEKNAENDETMKNRPKSANSISGKTVKSTDENTNEKMTSKVGDKDDPDEKKQLLNELEATSKGKVKESVLWSYLKSANQPFTLIFLVISILLTQILASLADIWISYW